MGVRKDYTGMSCNHLTAVRKTDRRSGNEWVWEFSCDCGGTHYSKPSHVFGGKTQRCAACRPKGKPAVPKGNKRTGGRIDRTGERFGRLVALEFSHTKKGHTFWKFQCDCGNTCVTDMSNAVQGDVKSCGCLQTESRLTAQRKHGMTKTRQYSLYSRLKKAKDLCEQWAEDFQNFWEDVGTDYSDTLSPKKLDESKVFSPDNIEWVCAQPFSQTDYSGMVFGKLTAVMSAGYKDECMQWLFDCECGNSCVVPIYNVLSGNTKSCGCLKRTHGMSDTRPANIHSSMKDRCNNPNSTMYEYYGGKGVTYTEEWEDFPGFWKDMEEGYAPHLTLDRIDPSLNYCKENCKWSTRAEQTRNRGKMKNNTSGVTGVWFSKAVNCWVAFWRELDSRGRNKYFSVEKYGDSEAFEMACEYRKKMIEELNKQGAGYSPSHGL